MRNTGGSRQWLKVGQPLPGSSENGSPCPEPLVGSDSGPLRAVTMMSLGASRGQPRGYAVDWRPRHAAGSLPAPRLCWVRAALEPGGQRPQSAGVGRQGPRAPGKLWSITPLRQSQFRRQGLGARGNQMRQEKQEAKPYTHAHGICARAHAHTCTYIHTDSKHVGTF